MKAPKEKKTAPAARLIELLRKHGWNEAARIVKAEQVEDKAGDRGGSL